MGAVIVQVSTERDDHFVSVDEDVLKEIAGRARRLLPPEDELDEFGPDDPRNGLTVGDGERILKGMREDFWKAASSAEVSRTSECDYNLVLDGQEDLSSWKELLDAWEAELDG